MNLSNTAPSSQKAVFTLSLDFELMWGTADRPYAKKFQALCERERRYVISRLLGLLEEFDICATWGIVGSLFLSPAEVSSVPNGPEQLYSSPDLVEQILRCRVRQDVGSHGFSHIEMREPNCSRVDAERELEGCVRAARKYGVDLKSFIFPRNYVGHLNLLQEYGFTCYRSPEPHWYRDQPRPVRRFGQLIEIAAARTPPGVTVRNNGGIWEIPGSMLYTPSFGARRYVPVWMRVLRARRGLNQAVRRNEIFHLWFHPTDLVCRMEAMMRGLREIFEHVARLREAGQIEVRSMADLVPSEPSIEWECEVPVGRS